MIKLRTFLTCCAFCFSTVLLVIKPLQAEITLVGLDEQPELLSYIQTTILTKHTTKNQEIQSTSLKADLQKALRAKGYYNSKIIYKENEKHQFTINLGTIYKIQTIEVIGLDEIKITGLKIGDVLDAQNVLKTQKEIFNTISAQQCFYNLSVKNAVTLNHENHSAVVNFIVDGQNEAKFGNTNFYGADTIKRKYLSRFLKYKEGECWNPKKLESTKTALLGTGLLSSMGVALPEDLPDNKVVPISFTLKERAARKIRLGTKYSTSEGPGVSAEWRHNNYFGSGEQVSVLTRVSYLLQSLGLGFTKPYFISKKQSLNASAKIERKDTDAFEETSLNIQSSINRKLSPHWTGNIGVALEASKITEDNVSEETFGLVSVPGRINFDNRDNVLDPHKGYSFAFGIEPFVDAFGESDPFFKSRITGSTYFDLSDNAYDPVLALRASIGGILGSDTQNIPASKRFYAGGGGSIRGFGFQEAGPVDNDDDPLGGRSLLETSAELRLKFTDNIGGVAFIDAGGVYNSMVPNFEDGIYMGAGVGARYYTNFGPIRFDVATPLNKRDSTDQNFQIYISIGQAF